MSKLGKTNLDHALGAYNCGHVVEQVLLPNIRCFPNNDFCFNIHAPACRSRHIVAYHVPEFILPDK